MPPRQSRQAASEWAASEWAVDDRAPPSRRKRGALHERTAKKQSTAAQPRTRCGTTRCAAPPADSSDSIVGALLLLWVV